MVKKKVVALLLVVFLLAGMCGQTFAASVEQAQVYMPEIDAYIYGDEVDLSSIKTDKIKAYMGNTTLKVDKFVPVGKADQGTMYVFLLDVSASLYSNYFLSAKQALLNSMSRLEKNDTMALITFGDSVNTVAKGGETYDELEMALGEITNKDNTTHFYDALDRLMELCSSIQGKRKIAIVISDGVDDTAVGDGLTKTELNQKMRQGGISLNSFCVDNRGSRNYAEANVNEFAALARTNGGDFYAFSPADIDSQIGRLFTRLGQGWILKLRSSTNIADDSISTLKIMLSDDCSVSTEVCVNQYIKDNTPPKIVNASYNSEKNAVSVKFSESVSGAELLSNFDLFKGKTHLTIAGIVYSETDGNSVELRLKSVPLSGKYTLTAKNITDNTMEKNKLKDESVEIDFKTGLLGTIFGLPLWLIMVLALIVILIICIIVLMIKKRRVQDPQVIVTPPSYVQDDSGKIRVKPGAGTRVGVDLSDGRGSQQYFELSIGSSIMFGRGQENDVILDFDKRVSRQHFCLEYEEGILYVMDFGSHNGTKLNNIAIKPDIRHRLEVDDVIRFGDSKMTIRAIG